MDSPSTSSSIKRRQLSEVGRRLRNDFFVANSNPTKEELKALHAIIVVQSGCEHYTYKNLQHWLVQRQKSKMDLNIPTNINMGYLSEWLKFNPNPDYLTLMAWAKALNVNVTQIVAWIEEIVNNSQSSMSSFVPSELMPPPFTAPLLPYPYISE
ncbi:hypothetical protein A0H81_01792 [Grifola frondosa]|uniref:Uncharacterized protein n=1 Tax=Grifola frondosa TaxID=5627 RepID=A0A1C7MM79_GRIFR|nr:hypothetical protein A0H81_01792 [Grifola frondosa]